MNRGAARELAAAGQDEEALAQWNRALELEPDDARTTSGWRSSTSSAGAARRGQAPRARPRARAGDPSALAGLAVVYAAGGDRQRRAGCRQLQAESARRYVSPVLPATSTSALGETTGVRPAREAYAARDPAAHLRSRRATSAGRPPAREQAAALRADPRYGDLLRRMGLVPAVARK